MGWGFGRGKPKKIKPEKPGKVEMWHFNFSTTLTLIDGTVSQHGPKELSRDKNGEWVYVSIAEKLVKIFPREQVKRIDILDGPDVELED
jgi:hypothetical protein